MLTVLTRYGKFIFAFPPELYGILKSHKTYYYLLVLGKVVPRIMFSVCFEAVEASDLMRTLGLYYGLRG